MNVLFIEKSLRTDKLAIMYLSAVLKAAGHTTHLIWDDIESSEDYMKSHPIDVVCWSMMTCESEWMFEKNRQLKEKFKFISIIGGPHPTFFPDDGIKDPNVDYVVQGAGELVINKILAGQVNTKCIRGDIPNINELPFPDRTIQYRYDEFGKARMKRFMAGRYCFFSCKYCFNDRFKRLYTDQKRSMWNRHKVSRLMEEMDGVIKTYGMEHAVMNDDDIAADLDWLNEFCDEIKKRKIEWSGLVRASSVTKDILAKMKDSGCEFLTLAIESANETTQKFLNRGNITNQDVENAVKWAKELGFKVRLLSMIGLPVDDPLGDALETLEFNMRMQPTESIISVFQPYRGTALWDYCLKKGLVDPDVKMGTFYSGSKLKIKDAKKIDSLYHWWPYAVRYQMPIDLVKILIEIEIPPDVQDKLQRYKWEFGKREFFKAS